MNTSSSGNLIIYLSLLIAMCLSIAPWPNPLATLMPSWTLLAFMYWNIALPHKVSVGTGFITGLLFDTLIGSTLGQNALIFSIASFLSHKMYSRLRNYRVWQQAYFVLLFFLIMKLLSLWISRSTHYFEAGYSYWAQALVSAIIWPFVFSSLRLIRRRFRVQ
ncbi:MAG TPA: rod shape-determining protein MreD [Cycloclasticus sp.]|nr:rod shape-determining protein MreD [Cycloclasticus sp.]